MKLEKFEKANEEWVKHLTEVMNKYHIPYYDILKLDDLKQKCISSAIDDLEELQKLTGGN